MSAWSVLGTPHGCKNALRVPGTVSTTSLVSTITLCYAYMHTHVCTHMYAHTIHTSYTHRTHMYAHTCTCTPYTHHTHNYCTHTIHKPYTHHTHTIYTPYTHHIYTIHTVHMPYTHTRRPTLVLWLSQSTPTSRLASMTMTRWKNTGGLISTSFLPTCEFCLAE